MFYRQRLAVRPPVSALTKGFATDSICSHLRNRDFSADNNIPYPMHQKQPIRLYRLYLRDLLNCDNNYGTIFKGGKSRDRF